MPAMKLRLLIFPTAGRADKRLHGGLRVTSSAMSACALAQKPVPLLLDGHGGEVIGSVDRYVVTKLGLEADAWCDADMVAGVDWTAMTGVSAGYGHEVSHLDRRGEKSVTSFELDHVALTTRPSFAGARILDRSVREAAMTRRVDSAMATALSERRSTCTTNLNLKPCPKCSSGSISVTHRSAL